MIILHKETTFKEPHYNHSYWLSNDKFHAIGYIPYMTTEMIMFKVPMKFNQKGRTFVEVK